MVQWANLCCRIGHAPPPLPTRTAAVTHVAKTPRETGTTCTAEATAKVRCQFTQNDSGPEWTPARVSPQAALQCIEAACLSEVCIMADLELLGRIIRLELHAHTHTALIHYKGCATLCSIVWL